jgi:hypothetical protein
MIIVVSKNLGKICTSFLQKGQADKMVTDDQKPKKSNVSNELKDARTAFLQAASGSQDEAEKEAKILLEAATSSRNPFNSNASVKSLSLLNRLRDAKTLRAERAFRESSERITQMGGEAGEKFVAAVEKSLDKTPKKDSFTR